jgi:hypothetical protein
MHDLPPFGSGLPFARSMTFLIPPANRSAPSGSRAANN